MPENGQFEVRPTPDLGETEATEAKSYWSSVGVKRFYREPESHWSKFMAEQILELQPCSVLEFGCNVGRNLASLRERAPTLRLQGVDINAEAVAWGCREWNLNLLCADESFLREQGDDSFDVCFTVSVLDHVPDPKPILAEMVRAARLAVLLLEPDLGEQGKVIKNTNLQTGDLIDTTPYSYSWDYEKLAAGLPADFSKMPYPLSGTNLGPYYWLFRLIKERPSDSHVGRSRTGTNQVA